MTERNINISNIETTINCDNKKIKINNIASPTSITEEHNLCEVKNAKEKLMKICDKQKTCQINNQNLDCPGFDLDIEYACVNDDDMEEENKMEEQSTITIETPKENNESVTRVIENGMNYKYHQASDNINDRINRLAEDPVVQLISYKPLIESPLTYFMKYKTWIILTILIIGLIFMGVMVFYFIHRYRRQ